MKDTGKKDSIKRLKYNNGQLLDEYDFQAEQDYHREMRNRHNCFVHSWGIVEGLEVSTDGTKITVSRGMAMDKDGKELVLLKQEEPPLPTGLKSAVRYLTAKFMFKDDDTVIQRDSDNTKDYACRTLELPEVKITDTDTEPAKDGSVIVLKMIKWDAAGKITVDPSARSRSVGSRFDPATDLTVGSLLAIGNVGVGTTSPENAEGWNRVLDVVHSINAKISVRASAIDARVMAHGGIYGALAGMLVGTKSNHALSLVTNAATRMTIDSAGKVGIGTAPMSTLSVAGGLAVGATYAKINEAPPNGLLVEGNVGIGTTSPENAEGWNRVLDVVHSINAKISVRASTIDARVMAHGGIYGALAGMLVGTKSNHALSLVTNAATRMTIDSAGNVGIGTNDPAANALRVGAGSVRIELGTGKKLSLGGSGSFEVDTPGVVGGRLIVTAGGKVGIGAKEPGAKLEVAVAAADADTKPLVVRKDTTNYLTMLNNGNVCVGTTDPGTARLKVDGTLNVTGASTLTGAVTIPDPSSLSFGETPRQMINLYKTKFGIGIQDGTQYFRTDKNFAWYKGGTYNYGELDAGGGTVQMVIKDGNIGIGTPAPQGRLHVSGPAQTGTGTITSLGTTVTGIKTAFQTQLRQGYQITASGQTKVISSVISSDLALTVDSAFSPDITTAIAFTFSRPALVVKDGSVLVQQLVVADGAGTPYTDNWLGMSAGISGTTKWLHIGGITDGDGTERKRRLALYAHTTFVAGKVGIGTADPGAMLEVLGEMKASSLRIGTGVVVERFDDSTLGDSSSTVPTAKAIKTYVDTQIAKLVEVLTNHVHPYEFTVYRTITNIAEPIRTNTGRPIL